MGKIFLEETVKYIYHALDYGFLGTHSTHKVQANSLGFYTVKPIFVLLSWKSKEAKQCTLDVGMSTSKLLNSKYRHQTQSLD